ncbi:MAG: response regulator, partial [Pseudobdellovibrionaceae bacterium]|nr:response regulator [Pseudobdellovibrionaceae bacterium]
HHGTIAVESELGKGSTFSFTLPVSHDDLMPAEPGAMPVPSALMAPAIVPKVENALSQLPHPHERKRILVADDDEVNLEVIRAQLSPDKYELVFAHDGNDACRLVEEDGPFDLILCDVMMPYKTGYEVTRTVRQSFGQAELPIILLTAKSQLDDLVTGFDAGANDYLTKPFAKKELLARLQNHLIVRQTNNALRRFVPKDFISLLGHEKITDVKLGDFSKHDLTIFFADIRNFTTIAEKLTADQTFRYISDCLARMSPHVRAHHGFIDKFIGDAVLALFPQKPEDAIQAAITIHREVDAYNAQQNNSNFLLNIGIGIHRGTTVLGTVGEPERFDVTVISDAVNMANRIEGLTKTLGIRCGLSQQSLPSLDAGFALRRIGSFHLAGKSTRTDLVELLDIWDARQQALRVATRSRLEDGLECFAAGRLKEALCHFEMILAENPQDLLVAHYIKACQRWIQDGMPEAFDGSLSFDKVA